MAGGGEVRYSDAINSKYNGFKILIGFVFLATTSFFLKDYSKKEEIKSNLEQTEMKEFYKSRLGMFVGNQDGAIDSWEMPFVYSLIGKKNLSQDSLNQNSLGFFDWKKGYENMIAVKYKIRKDLWKNMKDVQTIGSKKDLRHKLSIY